MLPYNGKIKVHLLYSTKFQWTSIQKYVWSIEEIQILEDKTLWQIANHPPILPVLHYTILEFLTQVLLITDVYEIIQVCMY